MHPRLRPSALVLVLIAGTAAAQVQHGIIEVTENDGNNNQTSVSFNTITFGPVWEVVGGNRGDYDVDFLSGPTRADDLFNGVLIVQNYDDARLEDSVTATISGVETPIDYFGTVSASRGGSGFFISVHDAPGGFEVNYNPALGFFPFIDGWLGGHLVNETNNGPYTVAASVLNNVVLTDQAEIDANGAPAGSYVIGTGNGESILVGDDIDFRRDGVLLVSGGKNEDNFGGAALDPFGNGLIHIKDNGDNGVGSERDPGTFVFIPDGTPGVTMGHVNGSGNVMYSQGDVTVNLESDPGTFRISVTGETPDTGTMLVVSPLDYGNAVDNPVFCVPAQNGTDWIVTTRDIRGMGLQDIGSYDHAFSFVFLDGDTDITGPGTPARDYLPRLDDVVAARFAVTEINPGNGNRDLTVFRAAGSDALEAPGWNRGDVGITWLDAIISARINNGLDSTGNVPDGIFLGLPTEFFRFNDATGGVSGWTTFSVDNGETHAHVAGPAADTNEINSDFAIAFFPTAAGFQSVSDQSVPEIPNAANDAFLYNLATFGINTGDPSDASAAEDGVLVGVNWDNNNRFPTVYPEPAGSADQNVYNVQMWDGATGELVLGGLVDDPENPGELILQDASSEYGAVYLPYSTPNLVAGQIASDGTIVSGTGGFTVAISTDSGLGFPIAEITIEGVDARVDGGVILANANPGEIVLSDTGTGAFAMAWEPGENGEFEIAGFNPATDVATVPAFSFAYIPAEGLGQNETGPACNGIDLDADGDNDADDIVLFLMSPTDIDGNGSVNFFDTLRVLSINDMIEPSCGE